MLLTPGRLVLARMFRLLMLGLSLRNESRFSLAPFSRGPMSAPVTGLTKVKPVLDMVVQFGSSRTSLVVAKPAASVTVRLMT